MPTTMSKLTPAHLKPLAAAFTTALQQDQISLQDALDFVEVVTDVVLERRVQEHARKIRLPSTQPSKR